MAELPPEVVVHALGVARRAAAAVFFDPGPRCWTMREGPRRAGLEAVMSLSDVILMTEVCDALGALSFFLFRKRGGRDSRRRVEGGECHLRDLFVNVACFLIMLLVS